MQIEKIIEAPAELTGENSEQEPVVLSTRIRLARNLQGYPFPGCAKASQRKEIFTACMDSLKGIEQFEDSIDIDVADLSDWEKQVLVERHLISRELSTSKAGAGVAISQDQGCAVMINEEDHLRVQLLRSGYQFKDAWKTIDSLDSSIEESLDFAFSDDLGYLTACPTNVGTGMRASAMMHLPGLVMAEQMEKVIRAVNQLGIAVRGLFGEGSDASGHIFQLSNQQTLGESETDIIKRITSVLNSLIEQEKNARAKLLEKSRATVLDKIGRAMGVLGSAHMLTSAEAMNLLSFVRLAIDLKMLPEDQRHHIDRLFMTSQPGHIQYFAKGEIKPAERDQRRAELFREQFSQMPPLNF